MSVPQSVPSSNLARIGTTPLPHAFGRETLSPYIGRERERATIRALLVRDRVRLLTLTGTAGVGKTRLAMHASAEIMTQDAGFDAVYMVSLASLTDPSMVLAEISTELGVSNGGTASLHDAITVVVRNRRTLLILDTFEHLTAAGGDLVGLLAACQEIAILVTSRTPIHVYGEQLMVVDPFDADIGESISDRLPDAIALFVERARAIDPAFSLDTESYAMVADICRKLEGIPLAIELAASRMRVLSLSQIQRRFDQRLSLLSDGPRDFPARQQSIAAAVAWSYDLLSPTDQTLLRLLSIFPAGFTIAAVEVMCRGAGEESPLALLSSLVNSSLVRQQTDEAGERRFVFFDCVREFGMDQLERHGEIDRAFHDMAEVLLAIVREVEPNLYRGRDLHHHLARLNAELNNLRAVMTWADSHDPECLAGIFAPLGQYWLRRSLFQEGRVWAERIIAHGDRIPAVQRLGAMVDRARMMTYQNDPDVVAAHDEALALARELDEPARELDILTSRIIASLIRQDLNQAQRFVDEARRIHLERGIASDMNAGRPQSIRALGALVALERGDLDAAMACVRECQALAHPARDEGMLVIIARVLGGIFSIQGYRHEALSHFQQALRGYHAVGERWMTAVVTLEIAWEFSQVRPEITGRLFGIVDQIKASLGLTFGVEAFRTAPFSRWRGRTIAPIAPERWAAEYGMGQGMLPEDALNFVLALQMPGSIHTQPTLPIGEATLSVVPALSRREREVIALIAEGLTDREIATKLGISYRTTTTYVASIFSKLHVASRAAAAVFAVRHGLDQPPA